MWSNVKWKEKKVTWANLVAKGTWASKKGGWGEEKPMKRKERSWAHVGDHRKDHVLPAKGQEIAWTRSTR